MTKRIVPTTLLALALALASSVAQAKPRVDAISIQGWGCGGCAGRTARVVRELPGVTDAKVELKEKRLVVSYDDERVTLETIQKAIEKAGFGCDMPKKPKDT